MSFADELTAIILDKGLHNVDISAKFEVAVSTVLRWRTGVSEPHPLIKSYVLKVLRDLPNC